MNSEPKCVETPYGVQVKMPCFYAPQGRPFPIVSFKDRSLDWCVSVDRVRWMDRCDFEREQGIKPNASPAMPL